MSEKNVFGGLNSLHEAKNGLFELKLTILLKLKLKLKYAGNNLFSICHKIPSSDSSFSLYINSNIRKHWSLPMESVSNRS